MSNKRSFPTSRLGAAVIGAGTLACVMAGPATAGLAAHADDDQVQVQNTETVQVYTDATGKVDEKRVYEQLVLTGHGDVSLSNPVSTDDLRNLDGFSGFDIEDGAEQISTSVDGQERMRTVSDFDGELPLTVSVSYKLDGKDVSPGDIVGKSGDLDVSYHVENVTGETQQIQVADGKGDMVTRDVDVVVPMVGSLTTVLPSTFTDVQSDQANVAGDGRGGTKMSFTMTLFPPIGSPTADFGYTAKITDGVIPDATISALPVDPLQSPSFKGGAESYQGGSETGADLTAGATKIDANLLKLRDGAAQLTAGLLKLYKGAGKLSDGLNNDAVPGTQQLADGATQLSDGAEELADGSDQLSGGIHRLHDGTRDLLGGANDLRGGAIKLQDGASDVNDGAEQVRDGASDVNEGAQQVRDGASDLKAGAKRLDGGIQKLDGGAGDLTAGAKDLSDGLGLILSGVKALPTDIQADPDFKRLKGALAAVQAGVGTDPNHVGNDTLLGGLNLLRYGLRSPGGAEQCDVRATDGNPANDCGVGDAAEFLEGKLRDGATNINQLLGAANKAYDYLVATAGCPARPNGAANPLALPPFPDAFANPNSVCFAAAVSSYGYGAPDDTPLSLLPDGGVQAQSIAAANALQAIQDGIGALNDSGSSTLLGGLNQVKYKLYNPNFNALNCDQNPADDPNPVDDCGIGQVQQLVGAGIDQLVLSISDRLSGVLGQAYTGSQDLYAGTRQLAHGTRKLADGSTKLVDGTVQLADGTVVLADGTRQLADGTVVLADGTRQLADGTVVLADGTRLLKNGAVRLHNGAGKLDDGGVKLSDGADQLSNGATQLDDGSHQLLSGLTTAADGSNRLRAGLQKAADGAPQLSDGATKLSKQGTEKLIEAGSDTTVEFGAKYAQIQAGAERAHDESMAFGAPQGADGLTAYTYEIRGEDGEGSRNWTRGIAAIALFGLGAGAYALRRRFV